MRVKEGRDSRCCMAMRSIDYKKEFLLARW